jgi:hypothetical protein
VNLLTQPLSIPATPRAAGPTTTELAALVSGIAADGGWRQLLGAAEPGDAWAVPLLRGDSVEVALVSWAPGQSTRAHDHGGALGAWVVLDGELVEDHFDDLSWHARPRRARVGPGVPVESGADRVHVVANPGPGPALTLQAHTGGNRPARLPLVGAASIIAEAAPWLVSDLSAR